MLGILAWTEFLCFKVHPWRIKFQGLYGWQDRQVGAFLLVLTIERFAFDLNYRCISFHFSPIFQSSLDMRFGFHLEKFWNSFKFLQKRLLSIDFGFEKVYQNSTQWYAKETQWIHSGFLWFRLKLKKRFLSNYLKFC